MRRSALCAAPSPQLVLAMADPFCPTPFHIAIVLCTQLCIVQMRWWLLLAAPLLWSTNACAGCPWTRCWHDTTALLACRGDTRVHRRSVRRLSVRRISVYMRSVHRCAGTSGVASMGRVVRGVCGGGADSSFVSLVLHASSL